MKIVCIGEAMIELSVEPNSRKATIGYAGDTLNTAIYLCRNIDNAHQIYFSTVLGDDQFSSEMVDYIDAEGIDCSLIGKHKTRLPGIYSISKDDAGDRTFSYWREHSAARTLFTDDSGDADFSSLEAMDVIYLSAITLAILPHNIATTLLEWLASFRKQGGRVAFDSNYRPRLWHDQATAQRVIEQAWHITDIALPSIDDEIELFEDENEAAAIERLKSYAIPVNIIKRGAEGPIAIIDGQIKSTGKEFLPASIVVDTTAAGDSFNGGFLASFLNGNSIDDAMEDGHNMAIKVIAHQGAIIEKA